MQWGYTKTAHGHAPRARRFLHNPIVKDQGSAGIVSVPILIANQKRGDLSRPTSAALWKCPVTRLVTL